MSPKTNLTLGALVLVILATLVEGGLLLGNQQEQATQKAIKRQAVELTQLPDLALITETTWLRHRSLTTPHAIFPEDGSLLDYYPASFVYNIAIVQSEPGVARREP
ncbi:MAG: hypothetical protein U9Q77_09205 [Candidatus Marinimicrobia bacterium]|nr:hypothetical protein [Candidatus Neomarinimicrobiota bacterium]